jgi:hypothetical protein
MHCSIPLTGYLLLLLLVVVVLLLLLLLLLLLQTASPAELAAIQQLQLHTLPDCHGWTALHYAAATHKVALVQQLLEIGADPAAADKHGLMPLHLACMGQVKQHLQLLKLWRSHPSMHTLWVSLGKGSTS